MTNRNGVLVRSSIPRRNGTVTPIHFTNRNAVPVRSGPFRALFISSNTKLIFSPKSCFYQSQSHYCSIRSKWCLKIFTLNHDESRFQWFHNTKINPDLFYLKLIARATHNRLVCHFGHACHRRQSWGVGGSRSPRFGQVG